MQAFEWSRLFETGLNDVDAQHRRLVDLLNSLASQLDDNVPAQIDALLGELARYTVYHFQCEENLMAEVGLDEVHVAGHRAAHQKFIAQVQAWMHTRNMAGQISTQQLVDYLANWLIFHILGEDRAMGRQVLAVRGGMDSHQALVSDLPSEDPRTSVLLGALHRMYADLVERNEQLLVAQGRLTSLNASLEQRVTERTVELEATNAQLQDERQLAIEAEKMASLGRMVAGFAHEVNTPIGIAVGAVSQVSELTEQFKKMLQDEEVSEELAMENLAMMTESSGLAMVNLRRAASLVKSFKRTAVDRSSDAAMDYSLGEAIDDVVQSLHPLFKRTDIVISVDCPKDLKLHGVPGALTQVLTNFCTNAHSHGFADGSRAGKIAITVERFAHEVELRFADDGVGMDAQSQARVFEPFFTTRRNRGGSGLGLYIAYNLVTQSLGGRIECFSTPGVGTEFRIRFPVISPAVPVPPG
jgi:hemerythrin-like metal-binding protein